ncbi:cell division protein [Niveomyces insectorum RCEF 264]|uniref:Nucleolar protein 16 n=1 Tax=Niveomyces insectorum RCEF 264 TaxID=1081102 RepID=A0A168AGW0_9HYPO|nr:cell division protein [Niveomyces insectorum RCEF 264]
MGRTVRQKRKGRSSRPVVKQPASRKRPTNPTGNVIIAENWDKALTLTQNYRRLGLLNRLRAPAGGVEKLGSAAVAAAAALAAKQNTKKSKGSGGVGGAADPFSLLGLGAGTRAAASQAVREVRVERDAAGKIVRVVDDGVTAYNSPLPDLLNAMSDEDDEDEDEDEDDEDDKDEDGERENDASSYDVWGGFADHPAVVTAGRTKARRPVGPRHVRHQSAGERAWLQALVDHYGPAALDAVDDADRNRTSEALLAKMARDRRRNPMQHTAADLRRRLATFRADGGAARRVAVDDEKQ